MSILTDGLKWGFARLSAAQRTANAPYPVTHTAAGALVGQDGAAILSAAEAAAVRAGMPNAPARCVLINDSMTDWYNGGVGTPLSSAIYTPETGVLVLTYSSAPTLFDGIGAAVWSGRGTAYTGLWSQFYGPMTRVSNTVWSMQLPLNLTAVPAATDIKAGLVVRTNSGRATNSFVNWLQMRMGWPLAVMRNTAQSGDSALGLVDRIDRDVLPYAPCLVIGQSVGINDLGDPGPKTESEIIALKQAAYERIMAAGCTIVEGSMTPVGSAEPARATLNHMLSVLRINDWWGRYARASGKRFHCIDHYGTFIDPRNASGLALSSAVRAAPDHIHPSTKSGIALSKKWVNLLRRLLQTHESTLPKALIDCRAKSGITISACSSTSDVVTVSATNHRWRVGDEFFVHNASVRAINGPRVVETVPTSGSFTFTVPGAGTNASITGRIMSRSPNAWGNPLFTDTSGGTNNMTAAGITGTVPALCSLGGAGTGYTGTTGTRAAIADASSELPSGPVGNEWYIDVSVAPAATSSIDFNSQGSTTYGINAGGAQVMTAGRSYVHECVLSLRSTDWTATNVRNLLFNFSVGDAGGFAGQVGGFAAQDATESDLLQENIHVHLRTPVVRTTVTSGQELNSAAWLVRVNLAGTGWSGATLTAAVSQMATWDVTGQEALFL